MSSPPPSCPDSALSLGWRWDYLNQKYVDLRIFPKILDVQFDPLSGLQYYSIDTLSVEPTSTRKPSEGTNKKTSPIPVSKEVTFYEFELPQEYNITNRSHTEEATPTIQPVSRRSTTQRLDERKEALNQRRHRILLNKLNANLLKTLPLNKGNQPSEPQ